MLTLPFRDHHVSSRRSHHFLCFLPVRYRYKFRHFDGSSFSSSSSVWIHLLLNDLLTILSLLPVRTKKRSSPLNGNVFGSFGRCLSFLPVGALPSFQQRQTQWKSANSTPVRSMRWDQRPISTSSLLLGASSIGHCQIGLIYFGH